MKFHCKIAAIFSFMFFVLSLNLIKTNATQTYKTVHIISVPNIAIGKSL